MTCLRTLGVLSVTLSLVWSMTLETSSSRYLEEERSFKIGVNNSVNPFNLVEAIHYANNSPFNVDRIQRLDRNSSLVLNTTAAALIVSDLSDTSHSSPQVVPKEAAGESRKIKNTINKKSSHKDDGAVNNFIKTTIKEIKQNITKTRHKITTTTKRPLKVSIKRHPTTSKPHIIKTISPITIKLTKPTTTKKPKVVSTPKSYGTPTHTKRPPIKLKLTPPGSNKKPKPTIKKILTKWKDSVTTISDLKQNWYEAGVPYPNPMPEITSSAPPFSISDTGSQIYSSTENIYLDEVQPAVDEGIESINPEIFSYSSSEPLQGVPPVLPISDEADLESVSVSSASSGPDTNPISTFNLDMLPSSSGLTKDSSGNQNGCPTVHISSSVLTPLQREECSDLNLVLNTHYHQNQDTRIPAISTYDGTAAAEDDVIEAIAEDPGVSDVLANAGGAAQDSGASTYAGAPGGLSGGSSGGTGGSGGSGGDGGGDGGFKLPELKPLFEATGYLMRGLWWLLQKLMNPWLYIVPIVLFFKLGFLGILTLFPWWIPFVFLYFSVRTDEPKNTISHVTHKHKPVLIKHHDGWYWDQHTKTWKDVLHPHRHRRSDEEIEDMIDDRIIRFGDKYVNTNNRTRKRLKRRWPTSKTLNNTIEHDTNHIMETNTSSLSIMDVRTPPKVQSQIKDKLSSKYSIEPSHAGVAIPVDDDLDMLEESTKKMNFYKLERPTTSNGGLSTWILLSGQTSPTSPKPMTKKPSVKPIIMKDEKNNETLMLSEKPMKIVKPVFKQRSTTPKSMTTSSSTKTTTLRVNTFSPSPKSTTTRKPTKLTKVKASLLQNMTNTKLNSTKSTTSITLVSTSTTNAPKDTVTAIKLSTTEPTNVTSTHSSASLPAEAKEDGGQELPSTDEKKTKKTQKRKKNKNKRRKPDKSSKEGNNKLKEVESAGTQLYSYLRSEIIPVTVGVSLVGLLVTAGLASYYLQPFAALRRSDPIDRKDTEGNYYYQDDYSNAMPEEEAIGKVIAGMPETTLKASNTYKQPTSRNTYPQNVRYRHVDRRSQIYMKPYGSVEDVKLSDSNYDNNSDANKFVVGNIPKEAIQEVTPAVVPEHGPRNLKVNEHKFVVGSIPKEFFSAGASPRNLKIRKRREVIVPDDAENEIDAGENVSETSTIKAEEIVTTVEATNDTTTHNVYNPNQRPNSFLELLTDLFRFKLRLGLELIQNVTNSVSTYVSKVHSRLDQHYRQVSRGNVTKNAT